VKTSEEWHEGHFINCAWKISLWQVEVGLSPGNSESTCSGRPYGEIGLRTKEPNRLMRVVISKSVYGHHFAIRCDTFIVGEAAMCNNTVPCHTMEGHRLR
jgi:hypothetical protein